jgi:hypothetical protein
VVHREPHHAPRLASRWAHVVAAYAVLTVVLTYPSVAHLGDHLIGDGGDGLQFAWNLWWMKRALVDLSTTPFQTNAIFHPDGVSLWLHTLTPLNGILSLPLQAILPLPVVYNLLVLLSFVTAGLGAFLLAYEETESPASAFVGGIVFTFCSYHFAHARGHLNLVSCQWLPLFALFVIRAVCRGNLGSGAWAGVFLALNGYTDPYYLLYAVILAPMLVAAYWRQRSDTRRALAGLGAAALVGTALLAPYVGGMIRAARAERYFGAHDAKVFSADLTSYFVPNGVSSYGAATRSLWSVWSGNDTENACFLGFSVIALLALALRRDPKARRWGAIALAFFVFSLGPELRVAGQATGLALPYAFLQRIVPFLDLGGVPVRMDIMVELGAAVLVARGCQMVPKRWIALVASVIVIERLALPYPTAPVGADPFYRDLGRDAERYGVLDLTATTPAMYFATLHGKNIVGGMVARLPVSAQRFIDETPLLPTLLYGAPPPAGDQATLARAMCERLKIRYVIAHDNLRRDYVATVLHMPSVRTTPELTVFACPPQLNVPSP